MLGCPSMRTFDATVRAGALLPSEDLALPEGEMIRLVMVRRPDPARWELARLAHRDEDDDLAEAGLREWAAALDREDHG